MNIVERAKAILLSPRTEWPVIEAEPSSVAQIYREYLVYLAAIPAIAGLIRGTIIGYSFMGASVRVGFFAGLSGAILGFVLTLAMIYVLSLIVDALAPTFKGQKNPLAAFKLVAFAATAGLVAGIGELIPGLGLLSILGALYTIYLIWVGIPVLMKCPPEKALPYTAVTIVCGIIAGFIVGAVTSAITPTGRMGMADSGGSEIAIKTPQGEVKLDTRKMEEAAKRMEEASKKMEAAGKSGDTAAAGKAAAEVLAAMSGGQAREPIAAADLKPLLPETMAGLKRESWEAQSGGAMGFNGSTAKATYRGDDKSLRLEITDTGGLAGLVALAGWMNVVGEKETPTSTEKVFKQGKRTIRERSEKDGDSEYTVVLENGVIVEARGDKLDLAAVKKTVESLDLGKLESMKGKGS